MLRLSFKEGGEGESESCVHERGMKERGQGEGQVRGVHRGNETCGKI